MSINPQSFLQGDIIRSSELFSNLSVMNTVFTPTYVVIYSYYCFVKRPSFVFVFGTFIRRNNCCPLL